MASKRKIFKKNYDIFANFITENVSDMIENFQSHLNKLILSHYKKDFKNEKGNYKTVIILPSLSKICERC